MNIINKIIYEDISSFYSLKTNNLDTFRKLIYFLATSKPGGISINKLAQSLRKDHSTIAEYLEMMREIGKETEIGSIRELFVHQSLTNTGYKVFSSDKVDLECDKYSFGGRSKSNKQIQGIDNAYLIKDDTLTATKNSIPIYLFGFLS